MDDERDDFRPVPSSDNGEKYRDRGMLGSYSPSEEPFRTPADVRFFEGFGADQSDLERGWCDPLITSDPAYDLDHYRSAEGGFLNRPRLPTERG